MTDKQKIFIFEYLTDHNATQAAIRAGYSKKTAYSMGQRLLKKVEVRKMLDNLQNEQAEKCGIKFDSIIDELKKIGFSDIDYDNISIKDKLKALEMICTLLGFDKEGIDENIEDISEEEREVFGDG